MTYRISDGWIGGQAPSDTSSTQKHQPGVEMEAIDETYGAAIMVYARAASAITYGMFVLLQEDTPFSATPLVTTTSGAVAVAMTAMASGDYGWFQRTGKAIGQAAAGYADNALVYAMASPAGQVSSTVVAGSRIKKALGASAVGTPSAGLAEFEIDRPFMDAGAAA